MAQKYLEKNEYFYRKFEFQLAREPIGGERREVGSTVSLQKACNPTARALVSFNYHGRFCGRGSSSRFFLIVERSNIILLQRPPSRGHLAILATGAAVTVRYRIFGKVRGTIFSLLHED